MASRNSSWLPAPQSFFNPYLFQNGALAGGLSPAIANRTFLLHQLRCNYFNIQNFIHQWHGELPPTGPNISHQNINNPTSESDLLLSNGSIRNKRKRNNYPSYDQRDTKKISLRNRDNRENRVMPSDGRPSATDHYLRISCDQPVRLEKPQHLLVVLDLNGTLLYRPNSRHSNRAIARPFSTELLKKCTDEFTVVIWSSARPENVRSMCDKLLPADIRKKIIAIWSRDKFDLSQEDYNRKVICYKCLTKLWEDTTITMSHPDYAHGARWDQTNTVLIDDSVEKARTEPYNLIQIPEFFGNRQEENVLSKVYEYLSDVSMFSNVSSYLRRHPFIQYPSPNTVAPSDKSNRQ